MGEIRHDRRLHEAAESLLHEASVCDLLPTPVPRLLEAAGLTEPGLSLLDDECIDQAPPYLAEKIHALQGKVQAVLDRQEREVHVRPDIAANGGGAFKRLHEVGHDILPWQRDLAFADDGYTLAPDVRVQFELEASQVAAELMFQRTLLERAAADHRISAATVLLLSDQFGASIHATFRRFVETHRKSVAGAVLIRTPVSAPPAVCFQRQEAFCSQGWASRFDTPRAWPFRLEGSPYVTLSHAVAGFAAAVEAGSDRPFRASIDWPDRNGELRRVKVEVFSNSYSIFLLLWPVRRRPARV